MFVGLLALGLLASGAAEARPLRAPATGQPAITVEAPDAWTSMVDSSGRIDLTDGKPAQTAFSLVVVTDLNDLDKLAAASMQVIGAAAPTRTGDVKISGLSGSAYTSSLRSGAGPITLDLTLVRADDTHVAVITMITFPGAAPSNLLAAKAVMNSIAIVH